jgi:hypothetical protein
MHKPLFLYAALDHPSDNSGESEQGTQAVGALTQRDLLEGKTNAQSTVLVCTTKSQARRTGAN